MSRYLAQISVLLILFGAAIFISRGTIDWVNGWLMILLLVLGQALIATIIHNNPTLVDERSSNDGERDLDRVLAGVMALYGPLLIFIVSGLDVRLNGPSAMPLETTLVGVCVALAGLLITASAMKENRYFYGIARIDREANHAVCSSGIYATVRHPGYLGAIVFDLSIPLVLGSTLAFVPTLLTILAIVIRTKNEDAFLHHSLDRYQDYAQSVKYRLIPMIW